MQNDEYDCIIIGAGTAGIAAAVELSKAGKRVLILESKNYTGGRARSFEDTVTGEIIDNGQHVLMGCYSSLLSIFKELATDNLLIRQNTLTVNFIDSDGKKDILKTSTLPGKAGVILGILNLKQISLKSKFCALELALRIQIGNVKTENLTTQDFLKKYRQSKEIIERFWEPIILATLNSSSNQASASLFVEVLKRAFFAGKDASQILIPSVGLSELFTPFPEWILRHGGKIHLGTSVEALEIRNGQIAGVLSSKGEKFEAKTIISALPPKQLLRILPKELQSHPKFTPLHVYQFSPIVSIYLWFDLAWCDIDFAAMLGTTIQWIFNRRKIAPSSNTSVEKFPGHISLTVSAGNILVDTHPEEVVKLCLEELKRAFPKASDAKLISWKVIKEKSATFLATPAMELLRLQAQTFIPNLFLAGDWTSTSLPATLEGAAQSGIVAARHAISVLNKEK
ncbi:MAG: FAD-dependent oxidoreductase [Ignavibacteriae bacterium]|nr:FAD-dependent oxidoreductase [Ignavibacteriota bacterium]